MKCCFQLNIEPNHTTLAGHCYEHDIVMASAYGMLGSVDSNTGSPDLGWDTDQFPMDVKSAALVMKVSLILYIEVSPIRFFKDKILLPLRR